MKKKSLLCLLSFMLLASCNNNENLTILVPTGAPSLAFYNHFDNVNFTSNNSPINIASSMTNNGSDIVVIDTIKGIDAINNGAPYKLAANITFGNFYLAGTGNDDNATLDKDDVIVSFGMGQTPQKVFELIYGNDFTNMSYVTNVSEAATCLISKKTLDKASDVDYVFIAQPVLTNALSKNKDASIYANIQEEYTRITGKSLIQAGLFIKDSVSKNDSKAFLEDLNEDIDELLANPSLLDKYSENEEITNKFTTLYGINSTLAKKTIENNNVIGLGFKYACDNKENINEFISLFNLTIKDEDIYQK